MNRLPKFGGDDGKWVYDRIMVVDCPNVIPKEQQDKQLLEKMYAERRGIVKKAVKALQTVIANGYRFTEPDSIAEARRDYQSANSTVISFYQLQRTSDMRYIIETTKTDAGTRVFPITEDVAQMFQAIIEDRNAPKVEKSIDGYSGFLFYDDNGMPLVAMHWQHRFNHMVGRYNDIYRVQLPNITPHVCRHTYCSNMAKSGMNPKTLQYLMGHSDISVTMNVYTHIGFDDAEEELKRMEEFRKAQAEVEQKKEKPMSQKMFKVV
jgi:site-specific recombinase XerC